MRDYKFDYICEMVEKWKDDVSRDIYRILGTPFGILLPLTMSEIIDGKIVLKYYPAKDYYGEPIDNIEEWFKQRRDYCEKLANEYEKEINYE